MGKRSSVVIPFLTKRLKAEAVIEKSIETGQTFYHYEKQRVTLLFSFDTLECVMFGS